jgi:hypothetical protein
MCDQQFRIRIVRCANGRIAFQFACRGAAQFRVTLARAIMSQAILHGFVGDIEDRLWGTKIGITYLQTNDFSSAGFERQDSVCHSDRSRLTQGIELNVEALHNRVGSMCVAWVGNQPELGLWKYGLAKSLTYKGRRQFISIIQVSSTFFLRFAPGAKPNKIDMYFILPLVQYVTNFVGFGNMGARIF